MLVEIELKEGESLPKELFYGPDIEAIHIIREPQTILKCIRLSESPSTVPYVNPNTFIRELRMCHTWTVQVGSRLPFDVQIPTNDTVYEE